MRLTYYPPPETDTEPGPKTYECATEGCITTGPDTYCTRCAHRFGYVRHGHTLADLHAFARLAVHTTGTMGMDWHERYDLAYSGIVEHLYSSDRPEKYHLVRAGQLGHLCRRQRPPAAPRVLQGQDDRRRRRARFVPGVRPVLVPDRHAVSVAGAPHRGARDAASDMAAADRAATRGDHRPGHDGELPARRHRGRDDLLGIQVRPAAQEVWGS